MLIRPCVQNFPGNNSGLSPSGYSLHPREAVQSLSKDQVTWLHLRPCLVPSWCGASRTIWNCFWSWGIPVPLGLLPSPLLPKKNRARKWVNEYECVSLHWTFLFMKLSVVFFAKSECPIEISIFGRKLAFLWKSVKSIRHRRENGIDTLKLYYDTLLKTLK